MGRTANGSAESVWARRMAEQRRSGLSVAEYCRRHDVSTASFYSWRKRLGQAVSPASSVPLFVPVELPVMGDVAPGSRTGGPAAGLVQIELPGGAVVTLPAGASAELVTTAIRAAMSAAASTAAGPVTGVGPAAEGRPC